MSIQHMPPNPHFKTAYQSRFASTRQDPWCGSRPETRLTNGIETRNIMTA